MISLNTEKSVQSLVGGLRRRSHEHHEFVPILISLMTTDHMMTVSSVIWLVCGSKSTFTEVLKYCVQCKYFYVMLLSTFTSVQSRNGWSSWWDARLCSPVTQTDRWAQWTALFSLCSPFIVIRLSIYKIIRKKISDKHNDDTEPRLLHNQNFNCTTRANWVKLHFYCWYFNLIKISLNCGFGCSTCTVYWPILKYSI